MVKVFFTLVAFVLVFALGVVAGTLYEDKELAPTQKTKTQVIVSFPEPLPTETSNDLVAKASFDVEAVFVHNSVYKILRHTYQLTDQMNAKELQQFALDAAESQHGSLRNNLIAISLRRLAEIDAQSTIEFVQANPNIEDQQFLNLVMSNWLYLNPEESVTYVSNLEPGSLQTQFAYRLIGEPQFSDPALTLKLEQILGPEAQRMITRKKVSLAVPKDAFQIALNLPDEREQQEQLRNAVSRWARTDPQAAFERIQQLRNQTLKNSLTQSVFYQYAEHDPDAAVNFLERTVFNDENVRTSLLTALASSNPYKALPLVERYTEETGADSPMRNLLTTWAQKSPEEAIAYIDNLDEEKQFNHYQSVYSIYLRNDPEAALDWVVSRFDDSPQVAGLALQQSVSEKSVRYALNILNTTSNERIRTNLIPGIASFKARQNHNDALDWLQEHQNSSAYEPALLHVIQRMLLTAPEEAATAIMPIISHDLAGNQAGNIASVLYKKDRQTGMDWIERLPNGTAKDNALSRIIHDLHRVEPDLAASYLPMIETPYRRDDASVMVAVGFIQNNQLDAEKIVKDLGLSNNAAEKVRDAVRQARAIRRP